MDKYNSFFDYLAANGKKENFLKSAKSIMEQFQKIPGDDPPSSEIISAYIKSIWPKGSVLVKKAYDVLQEYAKFCGEASDFTWAFNTHFNEAFNAVVQKDAFLRKKINSPIPHDTKINPLYLNGLSEEEFIDAFGVVQELISAIYEDIERSPVDWKFSHWNDLRGERGLNCNHMMQILSSLCSVGKINENNLVIDKKKIGELKVDLILKNFKNIGFDVEVNNKAKITTISIPHSRDAMRVFYAYFTQSRKTCRRCFNKCTPTGYSAADCYKGAYNNNFISPFSYRFVEDPATQTQDALFLAITDGASESLRKILYFLHDEAIAYGLSLTYHNPGYDFWCFYHDPSALIYKKKNDKEWLDIWRNWIPKTEWLHVGQGISWYEKNILQLENYNWVAKTKFKKVFTTHPKEAEKLIERFPNVFEHTASRCTQCKKAKCKERVTVNIQNKEYHNCADRYYYFPNPTLDDIKAILELHKVEKGMDTHQEKTEKINISTLVPNVTYKCIASSVCDGYQTFAGYSLPLRVDMTVKTDGVLHLYYRMCEIIFNNNDAQEFLDGDIYTGKGDIFYDKPVLPKNEFLDISWIIEMQYMEIYINGTLYHRRDDLPYIEIIKKLPWLRHMVDPVGVAAVNGSTLEIKSLSITSL